MQRTSPLGDGRVVKTATTSALMVFVSLALPLVVGCGGSGGGGGGNSTLPVPNAMSLQATGPVSGPFLMSGDSVRVTNAAPTPLDYELVRDASWLTWNVPQTGTVASGDDLVFDLSVDDAAAPTSPGFYTALVTVVDTADSSVRATVNVSLTITGAAPLGHWRLDETSGTVAADISGNGNDGTLVGDPQWSPGLLTGALAFDPQGDIVDVGDPGAGWTLDVTTGLSISVWVKPNLPIGVQRLVAKDNAYELLMINGGEIRLLLNNQNNRQDSFIALEPGVWQHVAVTWDLGGPLSYYINGELDSTQPFAGPLVPNDRGLGFGGRGGSSGTYDGLLDDIRVYGYALSPDEVSALAAPAPSWTAPVADFRASTWEGPAPLGVSFDGTGSWDDDGSVTGYAWDFGDGATASGSTAFHTYTTTGAHTVRLTVVDDDGATDIETRTVFVTAPGSEPVVVNGGSGGGTYAAGSAVRVLADAPAAGQVFDGWTGDVAALADPAHPGTVLTVPAGGATVTATYAVDVRTGNEWVHFVGGWYDAEGDQPWSNHANWGGGMLPHPNDHVEVGDDNTRIQHTWIKQPGFSANQMQIAEHTNTVTSSLTISADFTGGWVTVGKDEHGFLTVEGGTSRFSTMDVGGPWHTARGTVRVTGGRLICEGSLDIGKGTPTRNPAHSSSVLVDAGRLTANATVQVDSPIATKPGLLRVRGGATFDNTAGGVRVQQGVLEIQGANASLDMTSLSFEHPTSLLRLTGTGVSTINAGAVTFAAGTTLDVAGLNVPAGNYTIIDGASIVDQGLAFSAGTDTNLWSFAVDDVNGDLVLTRN